MTPTRSIATAAVILLACSTAARADTQSLNVTASIKEICKFSGAAKTFAFGQIDPSLTTDVEVTSTDVTYRCTNGTPATGVSIPAGTRNLMNGTATLPYTLELSDDTRTGKGFSAANDLKLTIKGKIAAADFADAVKGNYSDTVTLTITP